MQTVKLNNGIEMPVLGYGVFQVSPQECERCVLDAIGAGYRLIDTAQAYYNEEGVGAAVAKCGVPRSELFLTTKVWITNAGEEKAARSIHESLRKLRTDYIDLLLIHSRSATIREHGGQWNRLYATGRYAPSVYRISIPTASWIWPNMPESSLP